MNFRRAFSIIGHALAWHDQSRPLRKRVFFLVNALRHAVPTARWICFCRSRARRHGFEHPAPTVFEKPIRHYLRFGWSASRRVGALMQHHRLMERVAPHIESAFWSAAPIEVGRISDRGETYVLTLQGSSRSRQEGELIVRMTDNADNFPLGMITFSLVHDDNGSAVLIGGLQGGGAEKGRITTATRRLSGLRPKVALLAVVRGFAEAVGAQALYAVSRECHVSNEKNASYRRKLLADYDTFWTECEGAPHPFAGFKLPMPHQRPAADTEQRRRRHAHIASLERMASVLIYPDSLDYAQTG